MTDPASPFTSNLGVCSWSLQPDNVDDLIDKLRACNLDAVQLALDPIRTGQWPEIRTLNRLRAAGVRILSGMMGMMGEDYSSLDSIKLTGGVRPNETWDFNRDSAHANALLARRLGIALVSFHAGFIPHRDDPSHALERQRILDRLAALAHIFDSVGVRVALETGQEDADTLLHALHDLNLPSLAINFDPANMLLYDMGDPIHALNRLAHRVVQLHIKDAQRSRHKGRWGDEVPVGRGEVDWNAFLLALFNNRLLARAHAAAPFPILGVDLLIEREAGSDRVADIRAAADLIRARLQDARP